MRVALAGNPNSGKTTLFNALTGSNQFVGNWPGVTAVSYTHLDVYKRQSMMSSLPMQTLMPLARSSSTRVCPR